MSMASESDQTLPLLNPNQIHHTPTAPLPEADPTAPPPPSSSAARKLPIKRRSPPRPSPSPSSSGADPLNTPDQPPFKFQRIWSESDELRFLQGLLGCGAQGLVFPRDLNAFYDRFSESMPQPYTRSQLSEKLRRLRNKHRRAARGRDPARLAPHDRDVLHLCSRLWDPAKAATSPFAAAGSAGAGSSGNKRRRANPNTQGGVEMPDPSGDSNSSPHGYNGIISSSTTPGGAFLDENGTEDAMFLEQESGHHLYFDDGAAALVADCSLDGIATETAAAFTTDIAGVVTTDVPNIIGNTSMVDNKVVLPRSSEHRMASAVLDIFEECLREAKAEGTICDANAEESELAKRWRQQRIDELDVLSRRLRLLIEDATAAGH